MGTQRQTSTNQESKGRRGRRPAKRGAVRCVDGVVVPKRLQEVIDIERDNLSRAESVLGCLVIAMESGSDGAGGPYYPDVAQIARELVRKSINGLDSLALQQRLLRDRVEEAFLGLLTRYRCGDGCERLPEESASNSLFLNVGRTRVALGLRLHRRCYGRRVASRASSACSAAVNISG